MKLHSHTVLRRAAEIGISIESVHTAEITVNGSRQSFPNQALMVLTVFAQPISLEEGLKKIPASGAQDWILLTSIVAKLQMLGALISHEEGLALIDKNPDSFGSPQIHIAMLNDKPRTDSFTSGLQQTIRPGDVVLDIGTGTGVLAIAAARAGAKKVYAIEASGMADVAQATIDKTEVADRITLVRGWSTQVELPEKADVLVSEILGNDPFDENILQTFRDARRRLLHPNPRILPENVKVFVLPVHIPAAILHNKVLLPQDLDNWQQWYNVDFSALRRLSADQSRYLFRANAAMAAQLEIAGEPVQLAEVDFASFEEMSIRNEVQVTAQRSFNGLLMYFESKLGDAVLSTHPKVAGYTNSWVSLVWYFPKAQRLQAGDPFTVSYKYMQGNNSEISLLIP
ncbi:MAG: 50S ribosomal protein L11 methyltransferase [Chitinophagaceae bacterium]